MKVIRVDNFDRVERSDALVQGNLDILTANHLAETLNLNEGPNSDNFYCVVPDGHKLHVFNP